MNEVCRRRNQEEKTSEEQIARMVQVCDGNSWREKHEKDTETMGRKNLSKTE